MNLSLKRVLIFAFILMTSITQLNSQVSNEKRIEFELKEGYEDFSLVQFGENGLVVYSHAEKSVKDNLTWKIDRYSTDLEIIESKEIILSEDYKLQKTMQDDRHLYLFFLHHRDEYLFVRIDSKTLEVEQMEGLLPVKTYSEEIVVISNKVIVYCNSKKSKMLRVLDFTAKTEEDIFFNIEGYEPIDVSLMNIQVDHDSQELYFFLNANLEKSYSLYIMRFNKAIELQETLNLSEDLPWVFSTISGTFLAEGEYMFTGTYSEKSTTKSEGIFICKTTNGKKDFHKFYNFLEFEEFLDYLSEKEQNKIEKKKNKKEAQGDEFKLNYLMLSHNVHYMDGIYIYIGEAYYPTYYTYTVTTATGSSTTRVFDGYFYTHATIAGFDQEGEKLWDKTFEIKPAVKPFSLIEMVQVTENSPTELGLMFASADSVESKAINTVGEVVDDRIVEMIAKTSENDENKWTYSALTYWYDNFFLVSGSQIIKNIEEKEERGKRKRQVYFINKISYSF
jgi:hypothetical protein